jgi:hypothetical protein
LLVVTLALSLPARSARAGIPTEFDFAYQERTGFPLSHDDRVLTLGAVDALVQPAIHATLAPDSVLDWQSVRNRIEQGNHSSRRKVRVVRAYSDQPVYIYKGFALIPDPTRSEDAVDPSQQFDVELDCSSPDSLKRKRCISLHRDHVDNRGVGAVFLIARTIIVRGENQTGGLSLITMTENLWTTVADVIDLSARQDPAPTFGIGQTYGLFTEQIGSAALKTNVDEGAFRIKPALPPSTTNPWLFGDSLFEPLSDLQYQFDRAREVIPDYDWSAGDPCESILDKESCWKQREPRGFAGLDGGSWFGLTYRTTGLYARSFGQPGGPGGPGMDAVRDIESANPPVNDQLECSIIPQGCNPKQYPCSTTNPPAPKDECVCDVDTCTQTACNVNYVEELGAGADCVVTCGISALAKGQRGGQGGPGGLAGTIRISAVTKMTPCSITEDDLADPTKLHRLDEQCVNGQADEGAGQPADCASDVCKFDPNVTVCGVPGGPGSDQNTNYGGYAAADAVVDYISSQIPPGNEEMAAEMPLFDPILRTSAGGPSEGWLDIGEGALLRLGLPQPDDPGVLEVTGSAATPAWAPNRALVMPTILYLAGAFAPDAAFKIPTDTGDSEALSEARARGKTSWASFLRSVRGYLVAQNPDQLAGCEQQCTELTWAFVERVARYAAAPSVRTALARLAGYAQPGDPQAQPDRSPVKFVLVHAARERPPDMIARSRYGGIDIPAELLVAKVDAGLINVTCSLDLVSSFSTGGGQFGQGGPGGHGAEKRCSGWSPTIEWICVRPPLVQKCTRENVNPIGGGLQCPDRRCQTLYQFPELGTAQGGMPASYVCPSGYHLKKYQQELFGIGYPIVCPTRIDGPGGVRCQSPQGLPGVSYYPLKGLASKSLVRAWPRGAWAVATDRLHPLELLRRVGRANTLYKRGDRLGAAARYLSTRKHTLAALNAGLICQSPPCFTCPADPGSASTDTRERLCTLDSEMASQLGRLTGGENFYGYQPNYVPPPSLATLDPLAQIDLVSLVKSEITWAKNRREFWLFYGAILNDVWKQTGSRRNELNGELDALNAALAENTGSLWLSFKDADQRVDQAAAEIEQIRQVIEAIQGLKWKLQGPSGGIDIDAGEVALVVVAAAATAYGGPAAGFAAAAVWQGLKNYGKDEHSAGDSSDKGISLADFGKGEKSSDDSQVDWDQQDEEFLGGLVKGLSESDSAKSLLGFFASALGLSEETAKNTMAEVILDAIALQTAIELYQAGAKFSQALMQRRIAQQKLREAERRRAQILASLSALDKVDSLPNGAYPPEEVQYQIADLAFRSAAAHVDRAGELFFLLRRGAERDGVPADPATGKSTLATYELTEMSKQPDCSGVTTVSMDINFLTLDCFDGRASILGTYAGGIQRMGYTLDVQDTVIPASAWKMDPQATEPQALLTLDVQLEQAHRGVRAAHRKQKIEDITFFLETNDPAPAKIDILIRRPETNKDVYWVGKATDAGGTPFDVFQSFDLALAPAGQPGDLLYNILRSSSSYDRNAFACNGLDESSPQSLLLEDCTLSSLAPGPLKRAYLAGLSLIGSLEIRIPTASLGGRIPSKFFARYKYTHETQNPAQ